MKVLKSHGQKQPQRTRHRPLVRAPAEQGLQQWPAFPERAVSRGPGAPQLPSHGVLRGLPGPFAGLNTVLNPGHL